MLLGVRSLELVPFLGMWQERGRNAFLLISRERAFHAPRSFFEHANFTEIYYLKIRCVKAELSIPEWLNWLFSYFGCQNGHLRKKKKI